MASDKSPAFQFYPKDVLSDDVIACMTNEQFGCYVLLLSHAWLRPDGLPSETASLAKLARCTEARFMRCVWDGIKSRFELNAEGRYFNARLESERCKQAMFSFERSQSGKRGAANRWPEKVNGSVYGLAIGSAIVQPLAKQHSSSSSSSSSAEVPPNPPLRGGRRLTAGELQKAQEHLKAVGRCEFDHKHVHGECVRLLALARRGEVVPA
jgi:uncharacterized protein YdaU (DUF1376 family)